MRKNFWRLSGRGIGVALAASWIALAAPQYAQAQVTAFKQAVAESAAREDGIAAFYRARNFEPIWTGAGADHQARRAALIEALDMAGAHGLPVGRYDDRVLMNQMRAARTARDMGAVEVALSRAFLQFAHDIQTGVLEPGRVIPAIKREVPKRPDDELLQAMADGDPRQVMRSLAPQSPEYTRLMRAKMMMEKQMQRGGWGATVNASKLEPGQSGAAVVALRDRLIAMGYLRATASAVYDDAMKAAVEAFQADNGLEVDGVAGSSTLKEINVSLQQRLQSVLVAMERERWINLPEGLGKRHIRVNLTDFTAKIIDDDKVTFETRSVIGAGSYDRQTPEFSDVMEHMVINPSWYVPRSIIVKEYLPLLRRNPGAVGHLEITDSRGRRVNRGRGFSQYSASSFPFSMRQPPGPRNALGTVKFMFPNKYNIYLHDTPAKNLFSREVRAYSHGCIRLNDPHDFAYALLARQTADPKGFFQARLRSGAETKVDLEQDVPVHLIYRTAFTTAKGQTNFRRDIYGRDARIWQALRGAGVALTGQQS
ncbi:L,D-transpeptidase family protein [Thalassococcus sp. BH17M4-6]|uniref:L,D-transpeptidase family protein n=1 Tax=Thalassococcus sp. BH17M4-6 TaxID=3413148 RepID=UPI003BD466E1